MKKLTPNQIVIVAGHAVCDPRTVRRYMQDRESVSDSSRHRIEAALRALRAQEARQ